MAYYNKLNDKLRGQQPLPEGLSWENMESDIMKKMEGKKDKKRRRILFWLPLCLILGLGIGYFAMQSNVFNTNSKVLSTTYTTAQNGQTIASETTTAKQTSSASEPNIRTNKLINKDISKMSGDQNIVSQKTSVQSSLNDGDKTNTAVTSSNKKGVSSGLNKIQTTLEVNSKTPSQLPEQSINAEAASIMEGNNVNSNGQMILPDDVGTSQQIVNKGSEIMTTKPNTFLDDMPILLVQNISFFPALKYSKLISTQNSHLTYDLNFAKPATSLPSKNKYFGYTEIYASGGLSHWNLDNSSHQLTGVELMFNASEKSLTSINFGIRTDISFLKHIYTSTGLECLGLYSVYEYAGVKEVLVGKTNVVTQIRFDLLSNSSTNIYGDTTVYTSQNRNSKKRNSIFNVSIPVILGVQSRMGKWNFKAGLGGLISLMTKAQGKNEYQGNLVIIDHTSGIFKNTLGFGFTGEVSAQYQMSNRFFIGTKLSLTKFANTFNIPEKSLDIPTIYGISITSGMTF